MPPKLSVEEECQTDLNNARKLQTMMMEFYALGQNDPREDESRGQD